MTLPDLQQMEQYIRSAASQRGIDPDIAVKVARSEGMAPGVWQSNLSKGGQREPSYGPFQLLVGGGGTGYPTGMGNDFVNQTGLHPSDPSTWTKQVDFAMDRAAKGGWSPWYGAKAAGIGQYTGIKPGAAEAASQHPSHDPRIGQDVQLAGIEGGQQGMAGIPPEDLALWKSAFAEEQESPLKKIGAALRAASPGAPPAPRAPPMSGMGGASDGSGLLQLLNQSPQMMADVLYARRQGQA